MNDVEEKGLKMIDCAVITVIYADQNRNPECYLSFHTEIFCKDKIVYIIKDNLYVVH